VINQETQSASFAVRHHQKTNNNSSNTQPSSPFIPLFLIRTISNPKGRA
jgi:hypothetical protein